MFTAPPGHADFLADADTAPLRDFAALDVPGVGTVQARRPSPASGAKLAMSVGKNDPTGWLTAFVADHLEPGDLTDLLVGMVCDEDLPHDTVGRIARAVATWGTARPYLAVATLAGITAQHWRTVRPHLIEKGIPDPMRLPSLHALLDVTENLVLSSYSEGKPAEAKRKRDRFLDALYRPELKPEPVNGEAYQPVPVGFSDAETEASFDAFATAAG